MKFEFKDIGIGFATGLILGIALISGCVQEETPPSSYGIKDMLPKNIGDIQTFNGENQYIVDFEKIGLPTTMPYDYSRYSGYESEGIKEIERPNFIAIDYSKEGFLLGSKRHKDKRSYFDECENWIYGAVELEFTNTGELNIEGETILFCERAISAKGLITYNYHVAWYNENSGYYFEEIIPFSLGYESMEFYHSDTVSQNYLKIIKEQVQNNIREVILKMKGL